MTNLNQTATINPEQMDKLQVFSNEKLGVKVRAMMNDDGSISMNAEDTAIGFGWVDTSKSAIDGAQLIKVRWARMNSYLREFGFSQDVAKNDYIPETLFYLLGMKANNESAKSYQMWIAADVIPSIRKHGIYAIDDLLNDPDLAIRSLTKLKEERELRKSLELENTMQKQMLGELQPKVDYLNKILQNKSLVTITQIAKDYGMSGKSMNEILHKYKIQYKESDQWLLYSKYHDMGYTHSETVEIFHPDGATRVKMQTKWTQKGRIFLYTFLKSKNILPVIEQ